MIEYNLEPPAKLVEIVSFKIPSEYDYSWIEKRGDIILKICCSDGMVVVARLPWGKDEDPKDRHPIRQETIDLLD